MTASSDTEESSKPERGFWSSIKKIFSRSSIDQELKESLEEVIEEIEADEGTLGAEERSIIMNTLYGSKKDLSP